MKTIAAAALSGMVFGFGLAMSGMTDVNKVIGFLDLFGTLGDGWDPTLALVMGGGLLISLPFFQYGVGKLKAPAFADVFRIPSRNDIDIRLIAGAGLFGLGWGLSGLCPGPVFASLAYFNPDVLWFGVAMVSGMFAVDVFERLLKNPD